MGAVQIAKSAINEGAVTSGKPGSQLARLAIRRCWLATRAADSNCDVFTKPAEDASVGCPRPEILVVRLQKPLDYQESSHDDPERPEPSAVRAVFGAIMIGGWWRNCATRVVTRWLPHKQPY